MARRNSQEDHDRMVRYVAASLMHKGYIDVRAAVPGFDAPNARSWPGAKRGHVPDVTAYGREFNIFEVETSDSIDDEHTEEQWAVFAHFARTRFSLFWVVVPKGCVQAARRRLAKIGIEAKVWAVDPRQGL